MIIDFSTRMGAEVVAEFVAEEDIFQKVESLGVTYSQGYYISEPKQELT
ncbi:MAG: EAL domain-containing protein [Anaerocolumna sp.]